VGRILGGGCGVGGLEKGGNALRVTESQRCKSSASHESFQHHRGWSDCAGHIKIGEFCCLWIVNIIIKLGLYLRNNLNNH
jgi:hypothetical protein